MSTLNMFFKKKEKKNVHYCLECEREIQEDELNSDNEGFDGYYCSSCADNLGHSGWDVVDPDHNFDSFSDWDENGH